MGSRLAMFDFYGALREATIKTEQHKQERFA